jgi:anti-sigma factor RsiW
MPAAKPGRTYALVAVAAALLIAVGFFAGHLRPQADQTEQAVLDSHLRSLMPGHLADVQSTDQHTVKPWFNGKLDFSPPVTDLAQRGFPLVGGRVDSVEGRQVAALIYRRNQHVINVYVWPSRVAVSGNASRQGYNFVKWSQSGFAWWAISDLNANELTDFAALLRAAAP